MPVATSIAAFSAPELDAFGDCLFGWPFLTFVEEEQRGRARPVYFYERSPELAAFAPAYVYESHIPLTFRFEDFLPPDAAARLLPPPRQHLVVNAPMRLRSRVLATSPAAQSRLVGEILSWAKAEGLAAVVFPFVLGSDEPLRETLHEAGFASAFYEGDFYLPVAGGDLEGFLRTLAPSARKRFRNDMNRFRRSGLALETPGGIAEHAETLAEQHRRLMEKYRRPGPELTEESFRRFERLVPDRTFAVARDGARVVGFSLGMYGHGVLHLLRYARDPAADDDARLYGNLVFAEAVRQALALGCARVHFGKASHLAKAQRGCLYEEGIVFARCTDDSDQAVLEAVFEELDGANRERFARLIAPPTPAAAGAR